VKIPEKDILEGNILRVIFALGWPVMVTSLLEIGYNMADTFWLGRWGGGANATNAVAAMEIAWPIIFVMFHSIRELVGWIKRQNLQVNSYPWVY